ncbi:MAG: CBS domain-containing protein [Deltaproteobacteria bacterium]|jgi:tRNA nucleotidyltransferase (CCA-adding enzyme)|nr:CBS domain-containing protein [Deltaproteobacteria bacterium]
MNACDTLITCHANVDFDAFASLIGAAALYPDSVLLFPGTQERAMHHFFHEYAGFMYNFKSQKDIDFSGISRLVLVDCRQRSRVPHVDELLNRTDIVIDVWDHHPDTLDDVQAHNVHKAATGATVTLLLEEIRRRGISLGCEDASILGLGLYGDTGSFTFNSTSARDFLAAAVLRDFGMDLKLVRELTGHEMTSRHVQVLNALLESASLYHVNGISVAVADASLDGHLGDFAPLAHKLMEMERFEVLFALGLMGDRVQIVARSRNDLINVGKVCQSLGGGGHAYAASASVRDKTLPQVRDEIFRRLYAQVNSDKHAADYMSAPVVGIEEGHVIREAQELMERFGLKAVPVFKKGSKICVGVLDLQTAVRASGHGLEGLDVAEFMRRSVQSVQKDASLHELMDIIIAGRQRLAPVLDQEQVIGVVTRTDLINVFAEEPGRLSIPLRESGGRERDVRKLMQDRLPRAHLELLRRIGELGDAIRLPVYMVGGVVRDLLLERPNYDIDLVVEGNGIAFARALAEELGGRVREHREFLTAVVIYTDKEGIEARIDVATARLEYYEYPAALPTVELSSIKMDLFRRDFTINAMAIRLNSDSFGQLVDFFGGQRDMKERAIRVLHTLSFVEDPTRILRAIRFEQRYAFKLCPATERLIKSAVEHKFMDRVSGARLFHELKLMLEDKNPVICLERMDDFALLAAVHPSLGLRPAAHTFLRSMREVLDWYRLLFFEEQAQPWYVYLLGLCRALSRQEISRVLERLGFPLKQKEETLALRKQIRGASPLAEAWQAKGGVVSELYNLLIDIPLDGLLFMMARTESEDMRKNLSRFITQWRFEKVDISGRELLAMGLSPGPLLGRITRLVLAAKLNGAATSPSLQRILAMSLAQQFDEKEIPALAKKLAPKRRDV